MKDSTIALVTGADQGIGLQIAKKLAAHGCTVLVGSRDLERGVAAVEKMGLGGAYALQLDVTDQRSVNAAAERIPAWQSLTERSSVPFIRRQRRR